MSKYTKSVGKDKGGLHFKMVADTTETKRYVKNISQNAPTAFNNFLLRHMTEVMEMTQKMLYNSPNTLSGRPAVRFAGAKGSFGMDESTQKATTKIAHSLTVKPTRDTNKDKSTASVSMWSQDQENPSNYTSAGVRGSRARSGRRYAGKIAQYYEGGVRPFRTNNIDHAGFPKLSYMAKAQRATENRWKNNITEYIEQHLAPNGEVIENDTTQRNARRHVTESDIKSAMKAAGLKY